MFVVVQIGKGSFYTTNMLDQSHSNDFGLIKIDYRVTNGKSKRKRKEVKLWRACIRQNSDCLFRFFRNNSFFHISTINCKERKSTIPSRCSDVSKKTVNKESI